MELDEKTLKKLFPNLSKEIKNVDYKVSIDSVRTNSETGEKAACARFSHYTPDIIDFLRRCDTEDQAREIIDYMEEREEIPRGYAEKLRKQLKDQGVRSFGPKKEEDYYLKYGDQ